MKKILLSLSALAVLGLSHSQAQITNANFETWHSDYVATNTNDPNNGNGSNGWWDFNFDNESLLFGGSPVTVYEGTSNPSPEDSSHYAIIVSQTMSSKTYNLISSYGLPQTNGIIFAGYVNIVPSNYPNNYFTIKVGTPCTSKLGTLSFWYRYIPNGVDTCSCAVVFTHFNKTTNKSYPIGGGYWSNSAIQKNWTKATVNLTYDSSSMPDTITVQFSACAFKAVNNPKAGDTMDIDNVTTTQYLGIDNLNGYHDNVSIYPNPAQSFINLSVVGSYQASRIEVYDITGRAMGTYSISHNFLTINTQLYPNGLYFYKLLDDSGNGLNIGKFSIAK